MAGGWPIGAALTNATDQGSITASSRGTAITASSSTNTKGSWTQLVASSSIDCSYITVSVDGTPSGAQANVIDIGVGASGSEIAVIQNIQVMGLSTTAPGNVAKVSFPCQIPSGTRISARAQSSTASAVLDAQVILYDSAYYPFEGAASIVDTYGFTSSTTLGTAVDPGATIGTKGAYAQLTASTTADLAGFFLVFDHNGYSNATHGPDGWVIDIASGASGSEKLLVPNLMMVMSSGASLPNSIFPQVTDYFPIAIPSGTRLAARAACSSATASYRIVGVTLYGVRL